MIKRINYTGRRKIKQEDVAIKILKPGPDQLSFDANLSLRNYRLPIDSRIFVEAYRQTAWQRFDFGTVGQMSAPQDRMLSAFGSEDGVRFRVKVVEASQNGKPAKILRQADRIIPVGPEEQYIKSLLPIDSGDFRDEVWRVEFDESDLPILRISKHLAPAWRELAGTREFVSLVLPDVFRSILSRILIIEESTEMEDDRDWKCRWLKFAVRLPGVGEPPTAPEQFEEWIDNTVETFGRSIHIGETFSKWWEEDS